MTTGQFKHGTRLRISASAENYESNSIIYTVDKNDVDSNTQNIEKSIALNKKYLFKINTIKDDCNYTYRNPIGNLKVLYNFKISVNDVELTASELNNGIYVGGTIVLKIEHDDYELYQETINMSQDIVKDVTTLITKKVSLNLATLYDSNAVYDVNQPITYNGNIRVKKSQYGQMLAWEAPIYLEDVSVNGTINVPINSDVCIDANFTHGTHPMSTLCNDDCIIHIENSNLSKTIYAYRYGSAKFKLNGQDVTDNVLVTSNSQNIQYNHNARIAFDPSTGERAYVFAPKLALTYTYHAKTTINGQVYEKDFVCESYAMIDVELSQ